MVTGSVENSAEWSDNGYSRRSSSAEQAERTDCPDCPDCSPDYQTGMWNKVQNVAVSTPIFQQPRLVSPCQKLLHCPPTGFYPACVTRHVEPPSHSVPLTGVRACFVYPASAAYGCDCRFHCFGNTMVIIMESSVFAVGSSCPRPSWNLVLTRFELWGGKFAV